jgi:hypothetical protein
MVGFLARTLGGKTAPPGTIEWRFSSQKATTYDFSTNERLE